MVTRFQITAKALVVVALGFPQIAAADEFTGADVLEWSAADQDAMFQTSVTMIGIVATRRDDTAQIARCVDDWYFKEGVVDPVRNESIREAMRSLADYHPQAVILAVVEKACGKFTPD